MGVRDLLSVSGAYSYCFSSQLHRDCGPGAVARSEAPPLGPEFDPTSGTFFRGDLVMKTFLRPFSLFR